MMRQTKREINAAAYEQLRHERQRRGWSRAYIAEQIGVADPKTIGRWERGDAFPSAYFLQRLCTLFEMPAESLGLWQQEKQGEVVAHSYLSLLRYETSGKQDLQSLSVQPFFHFMLPPEHSGELVGRTHLLRQLTLHLCTSTTPTTVALSGLPGVGKSALAVKLAHDKDIQQRFCDGILWASLGPDVDVLDELKNWGKLLDIDENTFTRTESIEAWTRAIHARIGTRSMLLIIDSAWTGQDALMFKIGGPNCAYLLTTRIPTVALSFAGRDPYPVEVLDIEDSLELLACFVPELVPQETAALHEMAHLAGGLPLALQLIGLHLQALVHSGQPRRWRAAFEYLTCPEARLHLTRPSSPLEPLVGLVPGTPISLYNEIELSYRQLNPISQQALTVLANSLPCNRRCSEEDVLQFGIPLDALDTLLDSGLLASTGLGEYTLHQTIIDFARGQNEQVQHQQRHYLPSRANLLRHKHGKKAVGQENTPRHTALLENVLPTLVRGPDDVVRFSPSQLS